jgi:hypothetical protein
MQAAPSPEILAERIEQVFGTSSERRERVLSGAYKASFSAQELQEMDAYWAGERVRKAERLARGREVFARAEARRISMRGVA